MAIGASSNKADWDAAVAQISRQLFSAFSNVAKAKMALDTLAVSDLVAAGYDTTSANQLKSAFSDADLLRQIFEGSATQASVKDFRTFLKLALGTGLY